MLKQGSDEAGSAHGAALIKRDPTDRAAGPTFDQIRRRAYELWERNHQPMGFEIEFWLMAEKELRAERDRAAKAEATEAGDSLPPSRSWSGP
ncbi:DUF2934 domain-containing protein [Methylobacterium sp. W2]|uniref:DUF2934 domain-containing protein n=1 Tax=Methylobacterium sp. W2 TaxID=2598107 RepID=UPI00222311B0|nr:DUF2934 domain-containing protein [Methylobacterium sp. W2]